MSTQRGKLTTTRIAATTTLSARRDPSTAAGGPLPRIQHHLIPGPQVQLVQREAAADRVLKRLAGPDLHSRPPYERLGRIRILYRPSRNHDRVGSEPVGGNLRSEE